MTAEKDIKKAIALMEAQAEKAEYVRGVILEGPPCHDRDIREARQAAYENAYRDAIRILKRVL